MRKEDIFEALTDIDDKFIAAARPNEFDDADITIARPAPKKPVWKTLVPIAASLAVLGTAGVFGARYLREHPIPNSSNNASTASSEPERKPVSTTISSYEPEYTALKPGDGEDPIITDDIDGPLVIGDLSEFDGFAVAEFPDRAFTIKYNTILMRKVGSEDNMKRVVLSGDEFYLADLNGDGLRELCARSSLIGGIDYGYIEVYDIANDESYTYDTGSTDTVLHLSKVGGTLLVTKESDEPNTFPLTFDVLRKLDKPDYEQVPLFVSQTFTLPEYEGFTFTVNAEADPPTILIKWEDKGIFNKVNSVYLYDIDGDGKREMIMNVAGGVKHAMVYGIRDDGKLGEAFYFDEFGSQFRELDGKLVYEVYTWYDDPDAIEIRELIFDKEVDLSRYVHTNVPYGLQTWTHKLSSTSASLPSYGEFFANVADARLSIKKSGTGEKVLINYDVDELYTILDTENNSLTYVFINGRGDVIAVKLTETTATRYDLDGAVDLERDEGMLYVVNEDGTKAEFELPGDGEVLYG